MTKPKEKDNSFLREIFWPEIESKNDAHENLTFVGAGLACIFALSNLFVGLNSGQPVQTLLGFACAIAAYAIWAKGIYWLGSIMACMGLFNSLSLLYLKYLVIQSGRNSGSGIVFTLFVLGFSITALRSSYILWKTNKIDPIKSLETPPEIKNTGRSGGNQTDHDVSNTEINAGPTFKFSKSDLWVPVGLLILLGIPVLKALDTETSKEQSPKNPYLNLPSLTEIKLDIIEAQQMHNRVVVLVENDTNKRIKSAKIFWIPSLCNEVSIREIRDIQSSLKRRGFDPGPVDGSWGRKTRAAMQSFQRANNLAVSQKINFKTALALDVTIASMFKSKWLDGGTGIIVENSGNIQPFGRSFIEFYSFREQLRKSNHQGKYCYSVSRYY